MSAGSRNFLPQPIGKWRYRLVYFLILTAGAGRRLDRLRPLPLVCFNVGKERAGLKRTRRLFLYRQLFYRRLWLYRFTTDFLIQHLYIVRCEISFRSFLKLSYSEVLKLGLARVVLTMRDGSGEEQTPSFEMTWGSTTSSGYCSQEDSDCEFEQYFTARTSFIRKPRKERVRPARPTTLTGAEGRYLTGACQSALWGSCVRYVK